MIIGVDSASSEEKVLSIAVNGAFSSEKHYRRLSAVLVGRFSFPHQPKVLFYLFFKVSTEADEQNPSRGVFMQ